MNRRVARIKSVQALYQVEMTGVSAEEAIEATLEKEEEGNDFLLQLVKGTLENQKEIDGLLDSVLEHWTLSRLSRVDRAILRLCVYEMKYVEDVPVNVSINEAIDLAKGFNAEEEAGKFVNGVASKIASILENE
ncbi:transcription antitermination factor NusB [Alkalicoccus saliphilus]|jgi:transcription antitermination protein NusB|uniref:Transcription antitermination protein NusB n=1 Tax=Alkalicoccus saliphilus TaxID=200989 RepID=A0A2T4UAP9_9BACI|nr:transcription antitermination factor NusB [Alkalicoccus saliphilus]PTL40470.1 transcription antitermination factor NusB [Alkalicoccus saliphilus]